MPAQRGAERYSLLDKWKWTYNHEQAEANPAQACERLADATEYDQRNAPIEIWESIRCRA